MRSAALPRGRRRALNPVPESGREGGVTTTSTMPARRGRLGTRDVLLLGATGNSGALIGAAVAAPGPSVRTAGRPPAQRAVPAPALAARVAAGAPWPADL